MSRQVSTPQASLRPAELEAWVGFLRAHAVLTRQLNADLVTGHGLTLNDYEVLLRLSRAPERAMRRVDLANSVLLTPSGMTRLLSGLEQAGLVERGECPADARVTYAVLTDAGEARLREAAETHLRGVSERFTSLFEDGELETLASLLGRLAAGGDAECSPG